MAPKRPVSALQALRARVSIKRARPSEVAWASSEEDDAADFVPTSSRASSPRPASSQVRKRRQEGGPTVERSASKRTFGVPSSDETFVSSSNGICKRPPQTWTVPSLQRLALRSLSGGLGKLHFPDEKGGGLTLDADKSLQRLPEHLRLLVWETLLSSGSGLIQPSTISKHFVALPRVVLSAELPALHNLRTLGQISFSAQTTTLILTDLQFVTDASIADSIRKMPALEHIDLRGTIKVGEKTVRALQAGGHRLRSLNLGETAVHLSYLQPLLLVARQLTSLKLANLKLFNDPSLAKLLDALDESETDAGSPLAPLITLKLRGNQVSSATLDRLLGRLPCLERLDVSFNSTLRSITIPPAVIGQLRKLHLTGTSLLPAAFLQQLSDSPSLQLEALHLGALQNQNGWAPADIWTLSDVCSRSSSTLRKLFLAGNPALTGTVLSSTPSRPKVEAFAALLRGIAPFILHLDLSLIPLKSDYLAPAFASPAVSPIRELVLDETGIDAEVCSALAGCISLEVLRIKNSRVSLDSLFTILDHSPKLHTVDLTSCRGIALRQRRSLFEAYDGVGRKDRSFASKRR